MSASTAGRPGFLERKVAIVTGSSRGIGAATAREFAAQGARVVVNYLHHPERAQEVVRQITDSGGEAFAVQADVRVEAPVRQMLERISERWGSPDILVLNADVGGFQPTPFSQLKLSQFEERLGGEMAAAIVPVQAVAPQMMARRTGCVLAVSSALCRTPIDGFSLLATSKGALEAFIRALAVELGPSGVRANIVEASMVEGEQGDSISAEQRQGLLSSIPLRRIAKPEDIARVLMLAASDFGQFINGATLPVNGGQVLY